MRESINMEFPFWSL